MDRSALAGWTPVALNLAGAMPSLDWGDLRGIRFSEPFLHQTVERWAGGTPSPLVRTDLAALEVLDDEPSLDPAVIIFHASRCGSTLLSRLLGTVPGTLVVSEPAPVNALLLAPRPDLAATARLLRLIVRALGRRRFGDERRLVLKLSSWNVRRLDLLRAAFPAAAAIWVQREPAAIAASLLARPPGWFGMGHDPAARMTFGLDRTPAGIEEFCVAALASLFAAARAIGGQVLHLDYADLPAAAWNLAAPLAGIDPGPDDGARMRDEARYVAKSPGKLLFAGAAPGPELPPALRARVVAACGPDYDALDRLRQAALSRDWTTAHCL
jgi:hypothetical protein